MLKHIFHSAAENISMLSCSILKNIKNAFEFKFAVCAALMVSQTQFVAIDVHYIASGTPIVRVAKPSEITVLTVFAR